MLKNKRNIILLGIGFLLFVAIDFFAPAKIDWTPYFENAKKTPYGCYIIYDFLQDIFPRYDVRTNNVSYYQSFQSESMVNTNLIIINPYLKIDKIDNKKIMDFAERGNHVFISATQFPRALMDTLHLEVSFSLFDSTLLSKTPNRLNYVNSQIKNDSGYAFIKKLFSYYFSSFDTLKTEVLGLNWLNKVNFIRISTGNGTFLLHTQPLVFTNYHILNSNFQYACYALSYLPVQNTIWDEYYKPYKTQSASPLRIILSNKTLKTAYTLLMLSLLVYILFISKRRQRIIPVIKPPENTTLDFVNTLSNLHRYQGNYKDISQKKYLYFLDFVETKYYLKPGKKEDEFVHKLSVKSGVDEKKIQSIMKKIAFIKSQNEISDVILIKLNTAIESFYEERK